MTAETLEPHVEQLATIAEILLGAAHADGAYEVAEASAIGKVLTDFVEVEHLPDPVQARIAAFDPAAFDLARACTRLSLKTSRDRKEFLALVARVTDADAQLHGEEVSYLTRVAGFIGANEWETREFIEPD